jgi:hypothetical protein
MTRQCSVEGCGQSVVARGWCNAHYLRWRTHGDPRADQPVQTTRDDATRWLSHSQPDDAGCWIWQRALDRSGYGGFRAGDRIYRAHRYGYELMVGPIPEGLQIDHLCRVRACVNPAHLEPVTSRENSLRGDTFLARSLGRTKCAEGHPFDDVNTYRSPDGRRVCRICRRRWDAARRQREWATHVAPMLEAP